jgi:MFS family permease
MYILGFLFTLHVALPSYINSTYLSQFIGESRVGVVYTLASLLAIACFVGIIGFLKRYGDYKIALTFIVVEFVATLGLAFAGHPLLAFSFFIMSFVAISLMNFSMDIFLESFSTNNETGKIRGTYLTIMNLAWVISPFLAAKIIGNENFGLLFIVTSVLLIPVWFLTHHNLKTFKDPSYTAPAFSKGLGEAWKDMNIRASLVVHFLLQFFYAWMVIYTPMYLHETIGFSWSVLGIIFTVMLIPFALIEAPLGRLADTRFGEKEIMTAGFIIMALATATIALLSDHNPYIWAALLFTTRIGAAATEIMAETYLFKKVDATRLNIISIFRIARPAAYVVAPVIATILLAVMPLKGLFIALGFLMLYGIRWSIALEDTK